MYNEAMYCYCEVWRSCLAQLLPSLLLNPPTHTQLFLLQVVGILLIVESLGIHSLGWNVAVPRIKRQDRCIIMATM